MQPPPPLSSCHIPISTPIPIPISIPIPILIPQRLPSLVASEPQKCRCLSQLPSRQVRGEGAARGRGWVWSIKSEWISYKTVAPLKCSQQWMDRDGREMGESGCIWIHSHIRILLHSLRTSVYWSKDRDGRDGTGLMIEWVHSNKLIFTRLTQWVFS